MIYSNQSICVESLRILAFDNKQSLVITGPAGCGKTFIASEYAEILGIEDFQIVPPTVKDVQECIESSYQIGSPLVICFENLDLGVSAASYTILKFLEEPIENIYIVCTCRSVQKVPDTIISRSSVIELTPPTEEDLQMFSRILNTEKYNQIKNTDLFHIVTSFSDVEEVFSLTSTQIEYFNEFRSVQSSRDTISNLLWKLQKYPDGKETPIEFVIRYIMSVARSQGIAKVCLDCLNELSSARVSKTAVLGKLLFELKYGV